jgi:hypothetical protein
MTNFLLRNAEEKQGEVQQQPGATVIPVLAYLNADEAAA